MMRAPPPPRLAIDGSMLKNPVNQLAVLAYSETCWRQLSR